jgi:hypothetical protein
LAPELFFRYAASGPKAPKPPAGWEMKAMKQSAHLGAEQPSKVRHAKSWRIAEVVEGYVGVIMVAAAAVLLVALVFGLSQTGSSAPSWMH